MVSLTGKGYHWTEAEDEPTTAGIVIDCSIRSEVVDDSLNQRCFETQVNKAIPVYISLK